MWAKEARIRGVMILERKGGSVEVRTGLMVLPLGLWPIFKLHRAKGKEDKQKIA